MKTISERIAFDARFAEIISGYERDMEDLLESSVKKSAAFSALCRADRDKIRKDWEHSAACAVEAIELRSGAVVRYIGGIRSEMGRCRDQHFRNMLPEIERTAEEAARRKDACPNRLAEDHIFRLKELYNEIRAELHKLDNAFIPPRAAGVIGKLYAPFRAGDYGFIARCYGEMYAIGVQFKREIKAIKAKRDEDKRRFDARISHSLENEEVRKKEETELERALRNEMCAEMALGLSDKSVTRVFDAHAIPLGEYFVPTLMKEEFIGMVHGKAGKAEREKGGMIYPVSVDDIRENVFFITPGALLDVFGGMFGAAAAGVILGSERAKVIAIDKAGLGTEYESLRPLEKTGQLLILHNEEKISEELKRLSDYIAKAGSGEKDSVYILINRVCDNISMANMEHLKRIVQNGWKKNVFVLASNRTEVMPMNWTQALAECFASSRIMTAESDRATGAAKVRCGRGTYLFYGKLPQDLIKRAVSAANSRLEAGKTLELKAPAEDKQWQQESSVNGIRIPIGRDEKTGKEYPITMGTADGETRTFALMIGDTGWGKTAVLKAVIASACVNYSPEELMIEIGDFKSGCELLSWADDGVRHTRRCCSGEEPDTIRSFFAYYLRELKRREAIFRRLEKVSGRPVKDYRQYREAAAELGQTHFPALLIIIDEFMTVFDKGGREVATMFEELLKKCRHAGMYMILASQRAVTSDIANRFSGALKDYFDTRIVLHCTGETASTVLSTHCSDTGRENSGIKKAASLRLGHGIINRNAGQTERDTTEVQFFFADDDELKDLRAKLVKVNGRSEGAESLETPLSSPLRPEDTEEGLIPIGTSAYFLRDTSGTNDVFLDKGIVALKKEMLLSNIWVVGQDVRIAGSFCESVIKADASFPETKVRVFGSRGTRFGRMAEKLPGMIEFCDLADHDRAEQADHTGSAEEPRPINIILLPEQDDRLVPSYDGMSRAEKGLREILNAAEDGMVNIVISARDRALRSRVPYAFDQLPLRIISVGDMEMEDRLLPHEDVLERTVFDDQEEYVIKARWGNTQTGRTGKVYLYEGGEDELDSGH